jgi:hypothetical protein
MKNKKQENNKHCTIDNLFHRKDEDIPHWIKQLHETMNNEFKERTDREP